MKLSATKLCFNERPILFQRNHKRQNIITGIFNGMNMCFRQLLLKRSNQLAHSFPIRKRACKKNRVRCLHRIEIDRDIFPRLQQYKSLFNIANLMSNRRLALK